MTILAAKSLRATPAEIENRVAERRYSFIVRSTRVICLLSCPFWLAAMFFSSPHQYDPYSQSLLFVPLLAVGCMAVFTFTCQRDSYLKLLLGAGILARLAAASLYIWVGFVIYQSVDAFHYWSVGLYRVADFSVVGWSAFPPPYWNTNLVNNICGVIMLLTGDALPTLFVIFTLAALWGGYFFYRAFCVAFPRGDRRLFGLLVVLLPSILFWSSAIGKDALAQLFIGIAAYGFAKVGRKLTWLAILICAAGIAGMLAVRPHIAAMLAITCTAAFAVGETRGGWINVVAKVVLIPVLVVSSFFIIMQAGQFIGVEAGDSQSSINAVNRMTKDTQIGGSAFNIGESLPMRIAEAPFMIFRPFPWEVHSATAGIASLEAMGLLFFAWRRRRNFLAAIHRWREPFIAFILIYTVVFSIAFAAATSNFGILVRERIMMMPLLLMLFCTEFQKNTTSATRAVLPRRPWLPEIPPVSQTSRVRY